MPDQPKPAFRLEPALLLLAAGLGIGLIFPLSKLARNAGIPALSYIGLSAFGASVILFALVGLLRTPVTVARPTLRYAAFAGALTYAIPFGTLTFVVAHLGSGIPAILQSLTPIVTLVLMWSPSGEKPSILQLVGLALGLTGMLIILTARHTIAEGEAPSLLWFAAAFITPLALAGGNVYRSRAWPAGERPVALAALTFAAAAVIMLGLEALWRASTGHWAALLPILSAWPIVVGQALATGCGYFFFFRLQQVGGPVYLSQISYVNTGVGVFFAALLFGERFDGMTVVAILAIFVGIALVNREMPWSRRRRDVG